MPQGTDADLRRLLADHLPQDLIDRTWLDGAAGCAAATGRHGAAGFSAGGARRGGGRHSGRPARRRAAARRAPVVAGRRLRRRPRRVPGELARLADLSNMGSQEVNHMPDVEIYTQPWCPFCERAVAPPGHERRRIPRDRRPERIGGRREARERSGGRTSAPQIFIGGAAYRRLRRPGGPGSRRKIGRAARSGMNVLALLPVTECQITS